MVEAFRGNIICPNKHVRARLFPPSGFFSKSRGTQGGSASGPGDDTAPTPLETPPEVAAAAFASLVNSRPLLAPRRPVRAAVFVVHTEGLHSVGDCGVRRTGERRVADGGEGGGGKRQPHERLFRACARVSLLRVGPEAWHCCAATSPPPLLEYCQARTFASTVETRPLRSRVQSWQDVAVAHSALGSWRGGGEGEFHRDGVGIGSTRREPAITRSGGRAGTRANPLVCTAYNKRRLTPARGHPLRVPSPSLPCPPRAPMKAPRV